MAQVEIIDFLKENQGRFFTEREISDALGKSTCNQMLKSLRKFPPKSFQFKKIRSNNTTWKYVYQWRKCDLISRIREFIQTRS
jgi:hypothetical protein